MTQSTKKFLKHLGRDRAATPTETPARDPVSRYDALTVEEVLANLAKLPPADLTKLAHHERGHQNRPAVLARIDALLDHEPWPGYDALDVPDVRSGLNDASREQLATVLAYERAHKNRAGVLLAAQQGPAHGTGSPAAS